MSIPDIVISKFYKKFPIEENCFDLFNLPNKKIWPKNFKQILHPN